MEQVSKSHGDGVLCLTGINTHSYAHRSVLALALPMFLSFCFYCKCSKSSWKRASSPLQCTWPVVCLYNIYNRSNAQALKFDRMSIGSMIYIKISTTVFLIRVILYRDVHSQLIGLTHKHNLQTIKYKTHKHIAPRSANPPHQHYFPLECCSHCSAQRGIALCSDQKPCSSMKYWY